MKIAQVKYDHPQDTRDKDRPREKVKREIMDDLGAKAQKLADKIWDSPKVIVTDGLHETDGVDVRVLPSMNTDNGERWIEAWTLDKDLKRMADGIGGKVAYISIKDGKLVLGFVVKASSKMREIR